MDLNLPFGSAARQPSLTSLFQKAGPERSLRFMLKRMYRRIFWEYRQSRDRPARIVFLWDEVNNALPYINWRLLMRSYITKLKRRVRVQRRVQRTVTEGYVNQQSTATEFYKRLAVGV